MTAFFINGANHFTNAASACIVGLRSGTKGINNNIKITLNKLKIGFNIKDNPSTTNPITANHPTIFPDTPPINPAPPDSPFPFPIPIEPKDFFICSAILPPISFPTFFPSFPPLRVIGTSTLKPDSPTILFV